MLFNSWEFWIFFAAVYGLYLLLDRRGQNILLLIASYFFYGSWNYKFLGLILASTIIDYYCGIRINEAADLKKRKVFLAISVCSNLAILGFFKYYSFFVDGIEKLIRASGYDPSLMHLNIVLPVGISFYTFQTMSYTIDIYRNKLQPTRNILNYALFVAFFPKLVAGPIERARTFLPQIEEKRIVRADRLLSGGYLVLWGLFKKVFIADNMMRYADAVFAGKNEPGLQVLFGLYAFAFQIYADFSGYTDIARGLARLMGFELSMNFNLPYFARNPREFWQRWHITLSTWLKDYVYIPLGGNRRGRFRTYLNLLITMALCGLWHGAAWHFVLWGVYQGVILSIHRFIDLNVRHPQFKLPRAFGAALNILKVIVFFHVTCLGWLLFRADSLNQIFAMTRSLALGFSLTYSVFQNTLIIAFFTWFLMLMQLIQYKKNNLEILLESNCGLQAMSYMYMLFGVFIFGAAATGNFIYFQF